jgi:hypothetical protein
MNQDIIRMAREACDTDKVDAWHNDFWTLTQEELERFFHMARAAEREACAAIADKFHIPMCDTAADVIAHEIRSRNNK